MRLKPWRTWLELQSGAQLHKRQRVHVHDQANTPWHVLKSDELTWLAHISANALFGEFKSSKQSIDLHERIDICQIDQVEECVV